MFAADGRLIFSDPGTYNPANPDPSYIFAVEPDGTASLAVGFDEPTFPNGVAIEADGSIVWGESYTGRVKRQRPDGSVEDLGRLPGANPIPDGLKVGADGRLYVTDIAANGIHVLKPDGTAEGFFVCGKATTNCVFSGETLWVTNAGVLATGSEPVLRRHALPRPHSGRRRTDTLRSHRRQDRRYAGARPAIGAARLPAPAALEAPLQRRRGPRPPRAACCRVPVFDFADGGAEDERTLRRNEQAFDDVALLPRPLNGAASRDLSLTPVRREACHAARHRADRTGRPVLAGRRMRGGAGGGSRRHLLLRQPWLGLHAGGHRRNRQRRRAGCRCSSTPIAASRAKWWIAQAAAGYDALVLTIDNQMLGNRERDIRNGFAIPPRFGVGRDACGRHQGGVAAAHAQPSAETDLRQLRASRRDRGDRRCRKPHGGPARSLALSGPMSTGCAASGPGRCC